MTESSVELFTLDRLVHEPARLAILTVLTSCRMADFLFLQTMTGLPQANVSSHVATLEDAGLVLVTRTFRRKRPYTTVQVTPEGRQRYTDYWRDLDAVREQSADGRFTFCLRPTTD
jgi:DNA-binding transcriptional ArsR family regulator